MSPRSAEFIEAAKRRIAGARAALSSDPATALSSAYYAMLYAARAALSERDVEARTHSGTWYEFRRQFVEGAAFPGDLVARAQASQPKREQADYGAWSVPRKKPTRSST
jgi:uncharacterized protein (UPF0332 family)